MQTNMVSLFERLRYGVYGLAIGLFMGLFLGWMFHGFVGTLVRLIIITVILAPFVAALVFWVRITNKNREDRTTIQEAEWRDINPRG